MGRQYPNGYLADDNVMYPSYGAAVAAQQKREAARQQARRQAVTDMQPFANALRGLGRAIFTGAGGAVVGGASSTGARGATPAGAPIPMGRVDPFAPPAAAGIGTERQGPYLPRALPNRLPGNYSVPGVGTFDGVSGRMVQGAPRRPAGGGATPAGPPAAPGLGGYTPMVTPASRARQEAANQALQNAGGANISQPILASVPDAAVSASKEYAQARATNPMAELPAILDQRSQEYSQRADIQAWARANPELAARLAAKQRPAAPLIGQRSEAPDYSEGGAPTQPWTAADAPGPAPERGTVIGEKYYGKTWDGTQWVGDAQAPMAAGALGTQAAYGMAADGIEFVPQATAQASNLNFNSPLPQANASQAFGDEAKKLSDELARRYQLDIKNLAFGAV